VPEAAVAGGVRDESGLATRAFSKANAECPARGNLLSGSNRDTGPVALRAAFACFDPCPLSDTLRERCLLGHISVTSTFRPSFECPIQSIALNLAFLPTHFVYEFS